MIALPKRFFTQEEYAELESKAAYKSQYVAGEIYAMAGTEPEHVEIADNLTGIFRNLFRRRPCRSFSSDLKVRTKAGDLWTYPDLTVVCGEPKFDSTSRPRSLLNPQIIFEVLSPSTEAFDRGDKFSRYQRLESLTDYVLVSADRVRIGHFSRQTAGGWAFREYNVMEDVLPLASVECEIPLDEIYERVSFPDAANR